MHMKLDCNDDGVPNAETDSACVTRFVVNTASGHRAALIYHDAQTSVVQPMLLVNPVTVRMHRLRSVEGEETMVKLSCHSRHSSRR